MKLPDFLKGNALVKTVCECIWRSTVDIVVPFVSLYILELGGNYQTIGFTCQVLASLVYSRALGLSNSMPFALQ